MTDTYATPQLRSALALAVLVALGAAIGAPPAARAQFDECVDEFDEPAPCPATLPAIWPDRSKPHADPDAPGSRVVEILGWNLGGDLPLPWATDYEVVVVRPDGTPERAGMAVSDDEGNLLGDAEPDDGVSLGAPIRYTVPAPADAADPADPVFGVYEVRLYSWAWDEFDPTQEPVATTTFFYNGSGN